MECRTLCCHRGTEQPADRRADIMFHKQCVNAASSHTSPAHYKQHNNSMKRHGKEGDDAGPS